MQKLKHCRENVMFSKRNANHSHFDRNTCCVFPCLEPRMSEKNSYFSIVGIVVFFIFINKSVRYPIKNHTEYFIVTLLGVEY